MTIKMGNHNFRTGEPRRFIPPEINLEVEVHPVEHNAEFIQKYLEGPVTQDVTFYFPNWIFPWDRFVEYERSDAEWARPLGLGEEGPEDKLEIPNAIITCELKSVFDAMEEAEFSEMEITITPVPPIVEDVECSGD